MRSNKKIGAFEKTLRRTTRKFNHFQTGTFACHIAKMQAHKQIIPCVEITEHCRICLLTFRQIYLQGDGFREETSRLAPKRRALCANLFRSLVPAQTYLIFDFLHFSKLPRKLQVILQSIQPQKLHRFVTYR